MINIILLFALLCISYGYYPYAEQDHILNLGQYTWALSKMEYSKGLLVYFYQPYSTSCRQFWPELTQAAQSLSEVDSSVKIGKIDCYDETSLCSELGVQSYPTLALFRTFLESPREYIGPRRADAVFQWARKVVDSVFDIIDDEDTLFDRYSLAILLNTNEAEIKEAYTVLADDIEIAYPGPNLKANYESLNSILLTRSGEIQVINDTDTSKDIKEKVEKILYINKTSVPTFNNKISKMIKYGQEDKDFVLFFKTEKSAPRNQFLLAFDQIAANFNDDKTQFAFVNLLDDLLGQTVAKLFGVTERSEQTIGILSKRGTMMKKYKLEEGNSPFQEISQFIYDFKDGRLKRYYMSAPITDKHNGYIKELVGYNYKEFITNPELNVFVMFYYPWCDECVKMESTWKSLAYKLRYHENITVARIDVSENDIEGLDFSEFPVILFYPAREEGDFVNYSGDKNIKSLKKFLSKYIQGLEDDLEL